MALPAGDRTSLWHGTATADAYPSLPGDIDTDVLVVGGGITGLTTGLLLAEAGVDVTVVEARHLAAGTTGGTTGKVTSQHGQIYADLVQRHGEEAARMYGEANEAAIRNIEQLCHRHAIDADWTPADAYIYADSEEQVGSLRRELEAAQRIGLPADWTDTTELPYPVTGALRFTGQAQLHAVKYANGLARAIDATPNGAVHCATRVTAVEEQDVQVAVTTDRGRVTAGHVVLATLIPLTDRGFEFARARPMRAYGIAAVVDGPVPDGMYISAGQPSRSIRHHHGDDRAYIVVVGQSHEVGHERDTGRNDDALADFAREHFAVRDIAFRWSAQDFMPDDRLPFVGTTGFSDRIHVATGFQKWGLTNATNAARLLTDIITDRANPYAGLFDATRKDVSASARKFAQHNLDVAARFVGDRVDPDVATIDDIPAGTGATVRVGGKMMAVSRDDDGNVTSRSAVCTHLGCIVQWNQGERSWDCPCHGSRYDRDGQVLDGPTTEPLGDG